MTSDTPLSRLRAGLDRDEQLARAAAERAAEWRSDGKGVAGGPFTPADPEWGMEESGTHTIVYDEGWPLAAEAHHIARQCPQATLDRVEAIREVIADYQRRLPSDDDPALDDPEFRASWMGYRVAGELFLRALASSYIGGGCEHPDITLEDRSPIGDFQVFTYRCTACEDTATINRVAGDEPTKDEIRLAFHTEPTDVYDGEARP